MTPLGRILLVDDEAELIAVLAETLTRAGYFVAAHTSPRAALADLQREPYDILLSDLMMPGMDGVALLRAGLAIDPHLVGVIMTGQGTVATAVEAMHAGAYDFVLKPFKLQALQPVLARALDLRRLRTENLQLRETVAIHQLSQVIALSVDLPAILAGTCDAALQLLEADEASIMLPNPAGDELVVTAVRGAGRDWLMGQRVPLTTGIASWVARAHEPLLLNGVIDDPRFTSVREGQAIGSAISIPMIAAGKLVGVLNTNGLQPRRTFTGGQVKALSLLANTAAAALENARLVDTLAANEHRFRALIEHSSDAISLLGSDGRLQYVSPSTTRVLGYDPNEIQGADPAMLTHPDDLPALLMTLQDLIGRPGDSVHTRYRFRHQSGAWRWLEVEINNLLAEPSVGALVFNYRDISEQIEADAQLRLSAEILQRVSSIILVVEPDGQITYASPSLLPALGFTPEQALGDGWWLISQPEPDKRVQRRADITELALGRRPMPGRPVERLVTANDGRHHWISWQYSLGPAGQVIAVGQDITERKQRERELEAIATMASALRTATHPAEMVTVILQQVYHLIDATGTALGSIDDAHTALHLEAGQGDLSALAGQHLPLSDWPGSAQLIAGQPDSVDELSPGSPWLAHGGPNQSRALVAVPLQGSPPRRGVLLARRRRPFQADELRVLNAVADMAGSALNRAGLHEQTERQVQWLVALHDIDRAINNSVDLQLTFSILLEHVQAQLGVDAATILLLKTPTQRLEYAASVGLPRQVAGRPPIRLGADEVGRAALQRRVLIIPELGPGESKLLTERGLIGAGFAAYGAVPLVSKGNLVGLLEVLRRTPLLPDEAWLDYLNTLADMTATAIENTTLFDGLQRTNSELSLAYETTLEGWSRALDLRDKETEGHTQRVTALTLRLAAALNVPAQTRAAIRRGALLHDIGKMGIPDSILLKPGPLTDEEWVIMRQHPTFAYELLAPIAYLRTALDIPYCHHEKWDSSGYPRGLKGETIPLAARIFAVVDVWDALRSDRPYRRAWPVDQVRRHIQGLAGTHFDARVVEVFLTLEL